MHNNLKQLIVTVDDDPISLNTILSILKPSYQVHPFAAGETALKFLDSSPADLILLDCTMPGMNGFEVMDVLQRDAKTAEIPILFLTGKEDRDSEIRAIEMGAADYLRKPIEPEVLRTRVRHQLELQQYRKHLEALAAEKAKNLIHTYNRLRLREDATLSMLAIATDMSDSSTGDHIWRVTEFVRLLTEKLLDEPKENYVLRQDQAEDIIKSSKLHDVGKIAIPGQILRKPDRLTPEEFKIVKLHPHWGAEFLEEFADPQGADPFLFIAHDIALYHHEKWDGSGYPTGRKGEDIPLSARIVAVADVYDALISARPYKKAFTHEESMKIVQEDSGQHFDPHLVELFIACAGSLKIIPEEAQKRNRRFRGNGK
ncbi:response regulator [Brucepastera parasyntrophica]|uniref:HD domain-containing phosphohydrolase n=1 Tax=Brucepastera parasyntrophica TaxID=2880008 RepID=UPI00210D94CB|nr:HD domain-containing phosphohydrolase [Brucepastera parasyntrophica]ULQ60731.1 response regulator [Brucepastera parasyntrophica]